MENQKASTSDFDMIIQNFKDWKVLWVKTDEKWSLAFQGCSIPQPKCDHKVWTEVRYPGGRSMSLGGAHVLCRKTCEIGRWNIPLAQQQKAIGIYHITDVRKLSESIPPAYTKYIGDVAFDFIGQQNQWQ